MRFALAAALVTAGMAVAAPPQLEIPAEVSPDGQYVRFVPKTDAVSVVYVPLDGVEPFPAEFLKDQRAFVLDRASLAPNKAYRFVAVAAGKGGEQSRKEFRVVNGTPPTPVPVPVPVPVPPTPKPDGDLGLRKISREGAAKVTDRSAAKALAGANRATASAVAAGAANKAGVFDPAAALDMWRAGNKQVVGGAAGEAAWASWATAASGGLAAVYKGGKLPSSIAWAGAFNEIADGLDDAGN